MTESNAAIRNHIADRELLLEADGEASAARAAQIRNHLAGCRSCRNRKAGLERAAADFMEAHYGRFADRVPPIDGSRAFLLERLAEASHS